MLRQTEKAVVKAISEVQEHKKIQKIFQKR